MSMPDQGRAGDDVAERDRIEAIAVAFHDAYEAQAEAFGWQTQERSRVPWSLVPEENKNLMRSVIGTLLDRGVIQ